MVFTRGSGGAMGRLLLLAGLLPLAGGAGARPVPGAGPGARNGTSGALNLTAVAVAGGGGPGGGGGLLAVGDSVLDFWSWDGESIPDAAGAAAGLEVVNAAVSGAEVLAGDGERSSIPEQYRGGAWDWVLIDGGANDVNAAGCGTEAAAEAVDRIISADSAGGAIVELVQRAREGGAEVMLMSYYQPMPWSEFTPCAEEAEALGARYAALAEAQEGVHFADIGGVLIPARPDFFDEDGSHPSVAGSRAVGDFLGRLMTGGGKRRSLAQEPAASRPPMAGSRAAPSA